MKRFISLTFCIFSLVLVFAGCKKNDTSDAKSLDFHVYYSNAEMKYVASSKTDTIATEDICDNKMALAEYSMVTIENEIDWTNSLYVKKLVFSLETNQTVDLELNLSVLGLVSENENTSIEKQEVFELTANTPKEFEFEINRTIGNGVSKIVFSVNHFDQFYLNESLTGLKWRISTISFEAEHKI